MPNKNEESCQASCDFVFILKTGTFFAVFVIVYSVTNQSWNLEAVEAVS